MNDLHAFGMAVQIELMSYLVSHLIDLMRIERVASPEEEATLLSRLNSTGTEAASIAASIDQVAIHIGLTPEDFKANLFPDYSDPPKLLGHRRQDGLRRPGSKISG